MLSPAIQSEGGVIIAAGLGLVWLADFDVEDPEAGHWRREELRGARTRRWARLAPCEIAGTVAGQGREALRRLDLLAALRIPSADTPPRVGSNW